MGIVGFCIYGLVLIVITYGLTRTTEFTKRQVIFLVLAWIPFILWGIAMFATFGTLVGGGNFLHFMLAWLLVCSPLFAIIGLIVLVMWLMTRWRG